MQAATIEAVDLSDLDLLDGVRHRACTLCYPDEIPFGARFVAKCGDSAIALGLPKQYADPPNACPRCKRLPWIGVGCARCES